jgi:transcriptional regulator with XRE-family HTH domain
MKADNLLIGKRIREIRELRTWGLEGLKKATGISRDRLSRIENGFVNITNKTLNIIIRGLNVSRAYFYHTPYFDIPHRYKRGLYLNLNKKSK